MKNLLTSVACIMILLAFVLQFTQNQVLHNRLTAIDQAGNNFKEIIKQEGCITAENEKQLKKEICRILDCPEEDIRIKGGRERVFSRRSDPLQHRSAGKGDHFRTAFLGHP